MFGSRLPSRAGLRVSAAGLRVAANPGTLRRQERDLLSSLRDREQRNAAGASQAQVTAPGLSREYGVDSSLVKAAQDGDRAMVELLLQQGADSRIANDDGKTPASLAKEKRHTELAAMLDTATPVEMQRAASLQKP